MRTDYSPTIIQITATSEAGLKQASLPPISFSNSEAQSTTILEIFPLRTKQQMQGIGTSFTQSSAFVLAHLDLDVRTQVMRAIYAQEGANFPLARTHIGACDFCVDGKYSFADVADDSELEHFTIAPDLAPFDQQRFPELLDPSFTLLPMIKAANEIKKSQGDETLNIIASAWTAPYWMKTINDWNIKADYEKGIIGTGGELKPEHQATYASYLIRYLDAYASEGVEISGLTPVNEPHGNNGQWESMNFTPESQCTFIKDFLGPALSDADYNDVKLLIYDQNRDGMEEWADAILTDQDAAQYVYGIAVHWYESTVKVYEDTLDAVHTKYPEFDIIHTEGCIDDLGKPASEGILDPAGYQESDWFANDAFWWNENATDWAYTAVWANADDHPMYTPVHRYARNIIVSFNHWMSGWIDWNIVLDAEGGPNHVGNFCGAPIMIDTLSKEVYYTPIYHVLAQISRTIRPCDHAIETCLLSPGLSDDAVHACATINDDNIIAVQILNTLKKPVELSMKLADMVAELTLPANSVVTLQIDSCPD